jgi:hypothetical protein
VKTILVYTRPFTARFTTEYRALYGHRYRIEFVSDFKYRDDVGLVKRQYRFLAESDTCRDFDELDYTAIARRCRYLRLCEADLQRRLINSAWLAIREVFGSRDVLAFIGLPMDNYYLDLIDQYCRQQGIFATNPANSFLPDQTRLTRRGEHVVVREPPAGQVDSHYERLLEDDFRPVWLSRPRSHWHLVRMQAREVVKRAFFTTAKAVKGDPYSFHYNCVYPVGSAIDITSLQMHRVPELFVTDVQEVARRAREFRRAVFLPLQFSPETTLDYHIADSRFSDYEALLEQVLAGLPDDTLLVVKEHPDMYGYRPYAFYRLFGGRPNVVLVDVDIAIQQLFELCEFVLVTAGASTGAEAAVKGRTVISLGGAYYGGNGTVHEIFSYDDVRAWKTRLQPIATSSAERRGIVQRILSNTVDGPYDFVRTKRHKLPGVRLNVAAIMEYVLSAARNGCRE